MANRVLLGNRGGTYGLFVSKPGANVLTCDEEDMLLDSRAKETVSNPLESGTSSIAFSGTQTTVDTGFINYSATYDYKPILIYAFVSGSTVYPMHYHYAWTNTVTTSPAGEPIISTSSGYFAQSQGNAYTNKLKIFATRFIRSNGTIDGFANGTHTVHWAIFPVGEASVE